LLTVDTRDADQHSDVNVDGEVQEGVLDCAHERLEVDRVHVDAVEALQALHGDFAVGRRDPFAERAGV
jgi:hypothetical protein